MQLSSITRLIIFLFLIIPVAAEQRSKQPQKQPQPPSAETQKPAPSATAETQKPATSATNPKPSTNDKQWALIVGVSDYPGNIQDLLFPRDDAQAIRDLLVSSAGVREDHIRLLTDNGAGEARATKQNIFAAIDKYLAPRVQEGDEILVFFAGHGIASGLGSAAKSYFLPADAEAQSKESLERTSINLEELARKLSSLKASQFTMFFDACREDPFPGRGIKGNTMTDVMARGLRITPGPMRQKEPPTAIIFYSCQIGERAYENAELKHGVFTYYILKGIQELAARPDGRVEAGMLAAYLRENVRKWGEAYSAKVRYPVEQTPNMVATQIRGPMVVMKISPYSENLPAAPTTGMVTLIAPDGSAISIDGQAAGRGSIRKEFPAGEHTAKAELSGFQPAETRFTVLPGYQQEITLALTPISSSPSYEKGVQFESQGLWPQAIISYEMAISEDPNLTAAYERLAVGYLKTNRYRDAVELLTSATQKFPDNAALLARRSRALSYFAEADETQDQSINPTSGKGIKAKDADKEALKSAELAVQKAPTLALAHIAMGYALLLDEKNRSKALSSFVRASVIAPEDAEAYFGAGYSYRLMEQYGQAVPQFKKAVDLRPDYYEAERELAYCYHAMGRNDQAIRQYEVASSYRTETNDSGEMAGNNLALSALYVEKGEQVGGKEGEEYKKAGKGYEMDARQYDPTLKVAMRVLSRAGVSTRMERYLPSEVRSLLDKVKVPGKIKIPFGKRP
ncbi:MAG: caspase family protein [Blastocatellia bacterium]|nr:caspase family protein [Blastocatellia bacterium]